MLFVRVESDEIPPKDDRMSHRFTRLRRRLPHERLEVDSAQGVSEHLQRLTFCMQIVLLFCRVVSQLLRYPERVHIAKVRVG